MTDNTAITPTRQLTADDLDAIIATRKEIDHAFWRALSAIRKSGVVSANEIARRVGDAGIASRPTVLDRLREAAITDAADSMHTLSDEFQRASKSASRAAAALKESLIETPLPVHTVFTVQVAEHEADDPSWRVSHAAETIAIVHAYFTADANGDPVQAEDGTFEVHAPSRTTLDTLRQMLEQHEGLTIVHETEAPGTGIIVTVDRESR